MSEESQGEKRFDPTPKRQRDAAQRGDVLRSREAGTAAAMAMGALMLALIGDWLMDALHRVAIAGFRFELPQTASLDVGAIALEAATQVLPPIFAIGLAVIALTVVSQLLLGEGRFVPANLKPKGSRINPLAGMKRIFGIQGLIELGKSILKLILLGTIAWFWLTSHLDDLLGLGRGGLHAQLDYALGAASGLVFMLIAGLVLIAMVDYPLQRFQRNKRLKMSHEDLKRETKQTEGSPEVKMAQRQRQRDFARGSVAGAMKEAQFLVVNPMHFAVALTYDPERAPAPILLAKGRGETAMAMRELASENELPVLEYPELARAVYFTTRANQMVREELYIALAALVAFVLSLKRGERPRRPHIEVPGAMLFDADGKQAVRA
ncbi:EscU/YscU/HrcU family type III secretion system export apparatus switch protein [Erythrobacter sp.]|uniref:EscU/YscU/HrcU family type III secretion system export apparatus switch protein n=1 Tax=Erythrobacter sp. TaxID=1042 RepID=UPI002EBCF2B5|nr:flagellar type III secretion system protein FlhB [Erythrobacter sp.]